MKVELLGYPAYHASRVSWAKTIPLDWETGWLGECSTTIQTGPFGSQLHATEYVTDGIPVINPSNIIQGRVAPDWEITVDEAKATSLRRHRFKLGDIVFARRGEMGRCAPIGEAEISWLCGTGSMLVRLKAHRLIPKFAVLLLSQAGVRDTLSLESVGATMDNLNTRILAKIRIPIPPLADQQAILTFLDRETAKIDRLMAVRQKQVERLQEQRTAVIHHAVTKGLDTQAKMKPSGVEWLGDVPEGWTVKRLKYVVKCNRRTLGEQTDPDYVLDYIDIGNVTSAGEVLEIQPFEFQVAPSRARRKLTKGSTIISTVRTYLKAIAYIENPADNLIVSTGFAVLDACAGLRARFLYHAVASEYFIQRVIAESKGIGYPAINASDLINIPIAVPECEAEQDRILAHIDRETAKLDTLMAKYRREQELLAEYRASLISHAVTGKIDVRGLVEPIQ